MIQQLHAAWRARRVLLVGGTDRLTLFMQTLLDELGAKAARIAPPCEAEALSRALTQGRISAVIVPGTRALAGSGMLRQLAALEMLLGEVREAGVPLTVLMSDDSVYRAIGGPWYAQESDPIGGETPEGLVQSLLDLYACGAARGLAGDPVSTLCVRHLPYLGGAHPAVAPYSAWCHAARAGDALEVPHPGMQGVFIHPLDVCGGALLLGARFLLGDTGCTGAFNLGVCPQNLIPNRTAALRFTASRGVTRPLRETEPPGAAILPLPDGARARLLCGARCLISGEAALHQLYAQEEAAALGYEALMHTAKCQTQDYLRLLLNS